LEDCLAAARLAASTGGLFLNLISAEDRLRESQCLRAMFHVAASASMEQRALADAHLAGDRAPALWLPSLERYGAAQLNDRYRHAIGRPMSSAAWAGWFGVKVLVESAERVQSADGEALRAYLEKPAGFDGHKGELLTFRVSDHQLLQPLYVLRNSAAIVEIPSDSALSADAEAALDQLAGSTGPSTCHWPSP
jgi:hypothetical protein